MGLDTIMEQDIPEDERNLLNELLTTNLPAQYENLVKIYTRERLATGDKYTLNAFYSFYTVHQKLDAEQELSIIFNDLKKEGDIEGKIKIYNKG